MRVLIVGLSRYSAPSGICRYADMLSLAVSSVGEVEVSMVIGSWQESYFRNVFNTHSRAKLLVAEVRNNSISRNLWFSTALPELVLRERPDIIHFAYPVPLFRRIDCPTVVTVHDLYPFEVPENFTFAFANRIFLRACVRDCDAVICISQNTLSKLVHFIPTSADNTVLMQVYNPIVEPRLAAEQHPLRNLLTNGFILSVGQHRRNKNLDLLQRTFSKLRDCGQVPRDWQLVIVGSEDAQTVELHQLTRRLGLTDQIIYLSSISESELAWLYKNCAVAVFPSSHEGLCMPLVEALLAGARVVCSDILTMREIGRGVPIYFSLTHEPIETLASAICNALTRAPGRIQFGDIFDPNHVGQQMSEIYRSICKSYKGKENKQQCFVDEQDRSKPVLARTNKREKWRAANGNP